MAPHHCGGMTQDDYYKRDPAKTQELEQTARKIYEKMQDSRLPATFRQPELFNSEYKQYDPSDDPMKLIYRSTNREYGNFNPTTIEMPTIYRGKSDSFCKQQNYTVYRDSRMNCEMDKNRFMDPWATIRKK